MFCSSCGVPMQVDAVFCSSCGAKNGKQPATTEVHSAVSQPPTSKGSSDGCPVCKSSDAASRISSVRSTGSSATVGQSTWVDSKANLNSVSHQLSTSSTLVQRLTPPAGPWGGQEMKTAAGIGCGGIVVLFILGASLTNLAIGETWRNTNEAAPFMIFLLIAALLIVGLSFNSSRKSASSRAGQKKRWAEASSRLTAAWYCQRDDLVYDSEFSGSPEVFKSECFKNVVQPTTQAWFTSLAVSAGANQKAVQRILGHASAAMTLDTYVDLFDDGLDTVAVGLDAARSARIVSMAA